MSQDNNAAIDDDGLTAQEREILQTPMKDIEPQYWSTALAIRDKKANFNYAENDRAREEEERRRREEKQKKEIEADVKKHAERQEAANG